MPVGLNLGISKDFLTVRKSGLIAANMSRPTDWDEEPDWRMGKDRPGAHGGRPSARARPAAGTPRLHSTVDGEVVRRVGIAHQSGKIKSTTVSLFLSATFKITDVAPR